MKTQLKNKTVCNANGYLNPVFYLLACSTLLLILGCKKQSYQKTESNTPITNPINMNSQEQSLVGKWSLQKSETYEIAGTDSAGQYLCTLIASSTCDSLCITEFKNSYWSKSSSSEYAITGSIGGCDTYAGSGWKAKQNGKLQVSANIFDIVYLARDSVAFSNVYVNDILKLKSVVYYKRN